MMGVMAPLFYVWHGIAAEREYSMRLESSGLETDCALQASIRKPALVVPMERRCVLPLKVIMAPMLV